MPPPPRSSCPQALPMPRAGEGGVFSGGSIQCSLLDLDLIPTWASLSLLPYFSVYPRCSCSELLPEGTENSLRWL